MQGSDLYTVIFLILSVFVFFRMRSILGQRRGYEQKPEQLRPRPKRTANENIKLDDENVIPLPTTDAAQKNPWIGFAEEGSEIAKGLSAIQKADPKFHVRQFIDGAKIGYEMIIMAFAQGDRKTLARMVSKEVFEGFISVVLQREENKETADTKLIGFDDVKISNAQMFGKFAEITLEFNAKLVTFTKNIEGNVIEGSDKDIVAVNDKWTFSRDTSLKDPNWKLIETEE